MMRMGVPQTRDADGDVAVAGGVADRRINPVRAAEVRAEMALYLVIHTPRVETENSVRPPTRLRELAEGSLADGRSPRWIKSWTPDLHDDRIFTLWEALDADAVRSALAEFGFLDDMDSIPLRVKEWGPEDVLAESD
jgi:hypothetical protein